MKRTVIDCDKCTKETANALSLAIPNGKHRYSDGVETNVDFLYEKVDLCPGCATQLFEYLFRHKKRFDTPDNEPPELYIAKYNQHPSPGENDAIKLTLRYLGVKEK
jgi:hypothetical protein